MEQSIDDKVKTLKEARERWSNRATKRGLAAMFYGGSGAISTIGSIVGMEPILQYSRTPESPGALYGLALAGIYVGIVIGGAVLINGITKAIEAASARHQADSLDDQIAVIKQSPDYYKTAAKNRPEVHKPNEA